MHHNIRSYLEKQYTGKPDRASAFIFLLCIVAAGHVERVVVDRIYLAERLLHLRSRSLVLAEHVTIITTRWVVEVGLHLVVTLLVHNQHESLRLLGCTVEIMSQNGS